LASVSQHIQGLGYRSDPIRLLRGDVASLSISPAEGFLLSRIEGCSDLGELLMICGLPEPEAVASIIKLARMGIVDGPSEATCQQDAKSLMEAFDYDQALLNEPVDLTIEQKKELLFRDAMGATWHHYDVLGVRPKDPQEKFQEAYFSFIRSYHPDRFFGKNLGSYKDRIDRVVRRVREAYDLLSDLEKKAAYDRVTVVAPTAEELAEFERSRVDEERERKKKEERKARLLRRSPLAERKRKAADFAKDAQSCAKRGDWRQATNLYRLALSYDEGNATFEALLEEANGLAASSRCEDLLSKARSAAAMGNDSEAERFHREAAEADPSNSEALFLLVKYLFAKGRDPSTFVEMAQKVTYLERHNPEAWTMYGKLLLLSGDKAKAKRAFEQAVDLDETADEAKEALKQLRWKLF